MEWDLENLDHKNLKWDSESQKERFAYFEKQGYSLRHIAKYFYYRPMSGNFIHLRFTTLFGRGYEGKKYRKSNAVAKEIRQCVVCGKDMELPKWSTTKMHPKCRGQYWKDESKKKLTDERAKVAKDMWVGELKKIDIKVGE